jgi:hypothetical protein
LSHQRAHTRMRAHARMRAYCVRAACVRSEESRRHLLPTLHGASAEANCGDRMDNMQARV